MFRLLARKPVGTPLSLNSATTTIPALGTVAQIGLLTSAASGMQIYNGTAVPVQLYTGIAGKEIPLVIVPAGTNSGDLPVELGKGTRISAAALGLAQTTGFVIVNLFG